MKHFASAFVSICLIFTATDAAAIGSAVRTVWGGSAEEVYDAGFMQMLMKNKGGGVGLFNMNLIENDAPGSGYSEKGEDSDVVWGNNRARKILTLDDPRAEKAWFVGIFEREVWFLPASQKKRLKPLYVTINGNTVKYDDWGIDKSILTFRWFEFPVKWLVKGKNVIGFACPDAQSKDEGWEVWLARADERFPSLEKRQISPHIFRHTTAMHLLQSGVDITVIALWLGHESPATTDMYVEADLTMKEKALKKLQDPSLKSVRYQADESILSFLESL